VAVERNNPLPPNARYWVDVSPADQPAFNAWLAANRSAVKVLSSSNRDGWDWLLFEVVAPLVWWEGPGFPTKADAAVKSETDVVQFPQVQSTGELFTELGESIGAVASGPTTKLAIGAIAILLAVVALNRVMR